MTTLATILLVATGALALADWYAVHTARRPLELVFKPTTLLALIALAVSLDVGDETARAWFVVALAFSLAGDVFLMLAERPWTFPAGLGSFLVGHLAYVVGFWTLGVEVLPLLAGAAAVAVAGATVGRRVVSAVRSSERSRLAGPVVAYMAVISAMVVSAAGTGLALAIAGAALFYCSDALIAWNRFVEKQPHGRIAIIVTYHSGQALIVLSLVA